MYPIWDYDRLWNQTAATIIKKKTTIEKITPVHPDSQEGSEGMTVAFVSASAVLLLARMNATRSLIWTSLNGPPLAWLQAGITEP